jgi:hypothetical protein
MTEEEMRDLIVKVTGWNRDSTGANEMVEIIKDAVSDQDHQCYTCGSMWVGVV